MESRVALSYLQCLTPFFAADRCLDHGYGSRSAFRFARRSVLLPEASCVTGCRPTADVRPSKLANRATPDAAPGPALNTVQHPLHSILPKIPLTHIHNGFKTCCSCFPPNRAPIGRPNRAETHFRLRTQRCVPRQRGSCSQGSCQHFLPAGTRCQDN